jgi:sigma-B regulation protein RsbU (phosphoserine phosphatase)
VTAAARYTLRAAAVYDPTPSAALANLNAVLYQDHLTDTHRYCTVIFGILTAEGAGYTATLASGGHPPALLIRADGTAEYQSTSGGTLVGVFSDARFVTRTIPLRPGDTLLLYTDGLTEARTQTGARFGADALLAFVSRRPVGTATDLIGQLAGLLATLGSGIDDDVALMALSISV